MKKYALNSIFFDKKCPANLDSLVELIDFSRFEEINLIFDNVIYHDISLAHLIDINEDNNLVVTFIFFDIIANDPNRLLIRLCVKSRDKKKLIHI